MQLTAAVAQTATVMFDTAATVARAESLMHEAAQRGAQVLVFPSAASWIALPISTGPSSSFMAPASMVARSRMLLVSASSALVDLVT